MKIAILGFGEMGRMLAETICAGSGVDVAISNRTRARVEGFAAGRPRVSIAPSPADAASGADIVFLCVLPSVAREVLESAKRAFTANSHLVSIVSDLPIPCIEALLPCRVSRIVPTVISRIGRGITLFVRGSRTTDADIDALSPLLGKALSLREVLESQLNGLTAVTSCGPGLFSALFDELERSFQHSARAEGALVHELLLETLLGTCELARRHDAAFNSIYGQVATSGGITATGAAVLRAALPEILDGMNQAMHARHAEREAGIRRAFPAPTEPEWPSDEWKDWNTQ